MHSWGSYFVHVPNYLIGEHITIRTYLFCLDTQSASCHMYVFQKQVPVCICKTKYRKQIKRARQDQSEAKRGGFYNGNQARNRVEQSQRKRCGG